MSIIRNTTNNDLKEIIKNSFSYSECLRKLGLNTSGGTSSKILKEKIKELKIDTSYLHLNKVLNNFIIYNYNFCYRIFI